MTWRDAARAVLTIGWLMLLLPLQAGARCGGISYEVGGDGGSCRSVALIAAAVVGGVAVAVTAGVVVYRMLTASRPAADPSADLAAHLPAPVPQPAPVPEPAPVLAPAPTLTWPTGPLGGTPTGRREPIVEGDVVENIQAAIGENEGADDLARNGYQTHQKPTKPQIAAARTWSGDTGDPAKEPDYLIEGFVWDCYTPTATKSVRGIHSVAKEKVIERRQTQRVVVNLLYWTGDVEALRRQFADWPLEGLKQVIAIKDGQIIPIWNIWGVQ